MLFNYLYKATRLEETAVHRALAALLARMANGVHSLGE